MSLDVNISEPDEFNCNELHSCITSVAKLKNIEEFEYHVDYICGKGNNYIANIFKVSINERGNDKVNVVVKTLVNTIRQELFHDLHTREVIVYQQVIPHYIKILEKLDDEDKIELPVCLFASMETGKEVLIFEDLNLQGYERDNTLNRYENLDFLQVRTVLSGLAKFHGLSIVFERQCPEIFSKLSHDLKDIIFLEKFLNKSKIRKYFTESYEMSLRLVTNSDAKKHLDFIQTQLINLLRSFTKPRKFNVLCHGDYWINNVLFKYQEKKMTKICILDFQAMRYASPITDMISFLHICTDSKFRSEYFEILTNVYYDTLKYFLAKYDIELETIYTKNDFNTEVDDLLPYGLIIAMIELRIISVTPENENISRGSALAWTADAAEEQAETDLYKVRVNDVVNEFINNGVLDKFIKEIKS